MRRPGKGSTIQKFLSEQEVPLNRRGTKRRRGVEATNLLFEHSLIVCVFQSVLHNVGKYGRYTIIHRLKHYHSLVNPFITSVRIQSSLEDRLSRIE